MVTQTQTSITISIRSLLGLQRFYFSATMDYSAARCLPDSLEYQSTINPSAMRITHKEMSALRPSQQGWSPKAPPLLLFQTVCDNFTLESSGHGPRLDQTTHMSLGILLERQFKPGITQCMILMELHFPVVWFFVRLICAVWNEWTTLSGRLSVLSEFLSLPSGLSWSSSLVYWVFGCGICLIRCYFLYFVCCEVS